MKSRLGIDYGTCASGRHRPGRAPHAYVDKWPTVWDIDGTAWVYRLPGGFSQADFIAWAREGEVFGDDIQHIIYRDEVIFP